MYASEVRDSRAWGLAGPVEMACSCGNEHTVVTDSESERGSASVPQAGTLSKIDWQCLGVASGQVGLRRRLGA